MTFRVVALLACALTAGPMTGQAFAMDRDAALRELMGVQVEGIRRQAAREREAWRNVAPNPARVPQRLPFGENDPVVMLAYPEPVICNTDFLGGGIAVTHCP